MQISQVQYCLVSINQNGLVFDLWRWMNVFKEVLNPFAFV